MWGQPPSAPWAVQAFRSALKEAVYIRLQPLKHIRPFTSLNWLPNCRARLAFREPKPW